MILHLLRGLGVAGTCDSFTLIRLEAAASSTFASTGLPLSATNLFVEKQFEPIHACSAHPIVSLFLSGHFIPATFFDELISIPAAYLFKFFQLLIMIWLLYKFRAPDLA